MRLVLVSGGNIPRTQTQIHNESYGQIGLSHTHTCTHRTFPDISTDVWSLKPPEPCVEVTQRQPHQGNLLHPTYPAEWRKQFKKERGSLSTFMLGKGWLGKKNLFVLTRFIVLKSDAVIGYLFGVKFVSYPYRNKACLMSVAFFCRWSVLGENIFIGVVRWHIIWLVHQIFKQHLTFPRSCFFPTSKYVNTILSFHFFYLPHVPFWNSTCVGTSCLVWYKCRL